MGKRTSNSHLEHVQQAPDAPAYEPEPGDMPGERGERESGMRPNHGFDPDTDTHIGPLPRWRDIPPDSLDEPTPLDGDLLVAASDTDDTAPITPYSFTLPDRPSTLVASLTVVGGPAAGRVYPLQSDSVTIGRSLLALVQIDDVKISRIHARIVRIAPGEYYVEDLDSKNGTFLAGRPITRARLFTEDRLNIGPLTALRFGLVDKDEVDLQDRLYRTSTWDALTGVLTRAALLRRLEVETSNARDSGEPLCAIMVDLDHFKRVNDAFGHKAGDQVLRALADCVRSLLPPLGVVGRLGGEEFLLVLVDCPLPDAVELAQDVRDAVSKMHVEVGNGAVTATASIGVASLFEVPSRSSADLLRMADWRMYQAKKAGRDQVCWTGTST
jgi:diguanylate cyclase (GGDEF)-like protein